MYNVSKRLKSLKENTGNFEGRSTQAAKELAKKKVTNHCKLFVSQ